MPDIVVALTTAVVSSSVVATVLGFVFHRRSKQIEAEIRLQMAQVAELATSQRQWKERAVAELLGPVHMQLDRTKRAIRPLG